MDIKDSFLYQYIKELFLRFKVYLFPEMEVNRCYFKSYGKKCNLKKPQNLVEKIYWMELHGDTSLWTLCADKYRVREYVNEKGLIDYMPKLYGHWNRVSDIDFDALPNTFVIKSNNGCGTVRVIGNKNECNIRKLKKDLRRWLIIPYGWSNAQIHYTRIKPCILAEEVLSNDYVSISPESLVDFKVWCINGIPEYILVVFDRTDEDHKIEIFDTEWNYHPEFIKPRLRRAEATFIKPACLEKMLELSKIISEPFPEIRVDFYVVKDKPIIGELTFTAGYGNCTEEFWLKLGEQAIFKE